MTLTKQLEKHTINHGDIIQIGNHRLMCGDSTKIDDISRLMNGEKAEILFTSPPYADMRSYGGKSDLSIDYLAKFIPAWKNFTNFQVVNLGLKFKDMEVVEYWQKYIAAAKLCGLKLLAWNVWDKKKSGSIASATNMFHLTHEWIFVFGQKRKRLNRTIPNQLEKYASRYGENWEQGYKKTIRETNDLMTERIIKPHTHHQIHSVIQQTPELGHIRKSHPATFPIGLPSEYILAMTNENDVVSDCFVGSGTTMVAAEQTNRRCYAMEINPDYCRVILERMQKMFPNLSIKKI